MDIKLIDIPGFVVFWALLGIVFLQFFTRYVLNDSLGWTEEVARFLLVLLGFVGSITAVRRGTHIFLEFLYRFLPHTYGKACAVSAELITISFYGFCCWLSALVALKTNQAMISIPVPKSVIYWVVCISFGIMVVYSFFWLIHKLRMKSDQLVTELEEHVSLG